MNKRRMNTSSARRFRETFKKSLSAVSSQTEQYAIEALRFIAGAY